MLKDLAKRSRRITVGADKAYDVAGLVSVFPELNVHPHVIQGNKKPTQRHRRQNHKSDMASLSKNAGWWKRLLDG
jgi:hypothetical protein